jgi:hypothetical protein
MSNPLKAVWTEIENFFKKALPEATKLAQDAEPEVALLFPGISAFFNIGVSAASAAEAGATAAGVAGDTTAIKVSAAAAALTPWVTAYMQQAGKPIPNAQKINTFAATMLSSLEIFADPPPPTAKPAAAALPATAAA